MLWERPITLRMMFLLENLARNIAIEHRRTEDSNGEYSQDQKSSTPRFQSGDQSKCTFKRSLQRLKVSSRQYLIAVIFYIAQLGRVKWIAVPMESIMKSPQGSDSKESKIKTDHSVIQFDVTRR